MQLFKEFLGTFEAWAVRCHHSPWSESIRLWGLSVVIHIAGNAILGTVENDGGLLHALGQALIPEHPSTEGFHAFIVSIMVSVGFVKLMAELAKRRGWVE